MKNNKQIARILSLCLVAMLVVSGCQKNPEQKVVNGKDAIYSDENGTRSLPNEWKHSFENSSGDVRVKIDAKINIPNFEKLTENVVLPNVITVDNANKILKRLFPNSYYIDNTSQYDENMNIIKTKKEIEQLILEAQKDINDVKAGTYRGNPISGEEANKIIKENEDDIKYLQERYQTAPDQISNVKLNEITQMHIDNGCDFSIFSNYNDAHLGYFVISGGALKNGQAHAISITNTGNISNGDYNLSDNELTITKEDAENKAKEFIKENFEIDGLMLDYYKETTNKENILANEQIEAGSINSHHFYFVKEYGGVLETFIPFGNANINEDNATYDLTWSNEYFQVEYIDYGIFSLCYYYPTKVVEGTEKEVQILPFEKIQQRFEEQSKLTQGWIDKKQGMTAREVIIDDIRLGMMKVKQKDKNEYKMVPVWDFFGHSIETYSKQQEGGYPLDGNNQYVNKTKYSFMTINAVDGTVIDRKLGY